VVVFVIVMLVVVMLVAVGRVLLALGEVTDVLLLLGVDRLLLAGGETAGSVVVPVLGTVVVVIVVFVLVAHGWISSFGQDLAARR